jgi:hypothetical protein
MVQRPGKYHSASDALSHYFETAAKGASAELEEISNEQEMDEREPA